MNSYPSDNQILHEIKRLLAGVKLFCRQMDERVCEIEKVVEGLSNGLEHHTVKLTSSTQKTVAVIKARVLTEKERLKTTEDDFDIITDVPNHRIRFRKYPDQHSPLVESQLKSVGAHRFSVLSYLLEHSQHYLCNENANLLYHPLEDVKDESTLAQTIRYLRQAVGQRGPDGPYILTEPHWGSRKSKNARRYRMSDSCNYLLIR